MSYGPSQGGQGDALSRALDVFLSRGFHASMPEELEGATGVSWNELRVLYRDKEGLFLAAADQALASAPDAALAGAERLRSMLAALQRVDGNPRLRIIHKQALSKLSSLADGRDLPARG